MIRADARRRHPEAWSAVRSAAWATWTGLPAIVAASLGWAATLVPAAAMAALGAPSLLLLLGLLPALVATTGFADALAPVASGGKLRSLRQVGVDPVLGFAAWLWIAALDLLAGLGPGGIAAASSIGALGVLILPLALAYGGLRRRRGLAALRAGFVIAALSPSLAVTLAGLAVLAGFAVVATTGALVVVAPAFVALTALLGARSALETADGPSS